MVLFKTNTFTGFLILSFVGGYYVSYRRAKNKEERDLNKELAKTIDEMNKAKETES